MAEQKTDVYGPLPPKIDSEKYNDDQHFMPAMPRVCELRGKVNLTWLLAQEISRGVKVKELLSFFS